MSGTITEANAITVYDFKWKPIELKKIMNVYDKIEVKENDILCLIPYGVDWPEDIVPKQNTIESKEDCENEIGEVEYSLNKDLINKIKNGNKKYFIKLDTSYKTVSDLLLTFIGCIRRTVCEEFNDGSTIFESYSHEDDFEFNGEIVKINNCWFIKI